MAHIYNSQLDAYSLYHKQHETSPTSSQISGPALPALGHAISGSTGTAISNLALYPLDLIITRLQVQRQLRKTPGTAEKTEYLGVLDAAQKIYNNEGGIAAFYSGVLQDTGKSIADSFLFFLFYNYLRSSRLQRHGANTTTLPVLDELGVGALAGACSKFFTTPLANIVTRKQTARMLSASSSSPEKEPSVADIAAQIRSEKGLLGFWSGYSASLVLTLNPSLTFFLYETFKRTLLPRSKRDDPGARITFLMAAVSKACASSVTYPFSLAKARSQAGSRAPVKPSEAETLKDDVSATQKEKTTEGRKGQLKGLSRDLKATARHSTVFSTILEIYRTEGLAALYEGILGEICKGFFSHGTTMLVKEAVHKVIIQLYFFILKLLKRVPEQFGQARAAVQEQAQNLSEKAQTLSGNATEAVKTRYEAAGTASGEAYEAAKGQVSELSGKAQELGSSAVATAASALQTVKSQASSVAEQAQSTATGVVESSKAAASVAGERASNVYEGASQVAGNAYEGAKQGASDLLGSGKNMAANASEGVQSGGSYASERAGKILESAREVVGKTVEGAGRGIRGADDGEGGK